MDEMVAVIVVWSGSGMVAGVVSGLAWSWVLDPDLNPDPGLGLGLGLDSASAGCPLAVCSVFLSQGIEIDGGLEPELEPLI